MADVVEPEGGGAAITSRKNSAEYVETLPVLEAPKEMPDYVTYVKGSDLRKARTQLERLKNAKFALGELLLAVASLCLGAYLGVLPSSVEGVYLSFFYKTLLPVLGCGTAIAYCFVRRIDIVSSKDVASDVLDRLPLLSKDLSASEDQKVQVSVKIDDSTIAESEVSAAQQTPESAAFEAKASDDSYLDVGVQYAVALSKGNDEEAEVIDKKQSLLVEKLGAPHTWRWAAERSFWQTLAKKGSGFDHMIELAAESDNDPQVCAALAAAYRARKEHFAASQWYKTAANQAEKKIDQINFMGEAAIEMLQAGSRTGALDIYREFIALNPVVHGEKMAAAKKAALLFERLKAPNFEVALQEVALELDPADEDLRFSVAYTHSERERDALSAYHYDLIPAHRRSGDAWNNLGVAWSRLNLDSAAFAAYSKAHDLGVTLGTSNMANMLIHAGMHSPASELLNEVKTGEHDVAVDRSVVRLHEEIEESKSRAKQKLQNAPEVINFFRQLGRAALSPQVEIRQKSFADDVYEMTISIVDGTISGKARKRQALNALTARIALADGNKPVPATRTEEFTVTGDAYGAAIEAMLHGSRDNSTSLLTSESRDIPMFIVVREAGAELLCIESDGKDWKQRFLQEQPAEAKSS
ncbi:hypothetical protein RJO15_04515 [Herbaspirillum huttiense F1]|uniref:hypothetical protein n=1 Tax=Herbaspirillum huttiense TaxID=863372 RepID=UPI000EB1B98E|nr:hypothetical protein [Herbaspirillum huttiense]MDT0355025.1 hypothetical protein [Herbaspirillum huttiense F1]